MREPGAFLKPRASSRLAASEGVEAVAPFNIAIAGDLTYRRPGSQTVFELTLPVYSPITQQESTFAPVLLP